MAVDTAPKRRSVSGIIPGLTIVGVSMDATPGAAWRQSAGWGYEGLVVVRGTELERSPAPVGAGFQRSPPVPEVTL